MKIVSLITITLIVLGCKNKASQPPFFKDRIAGENPIEICILKESKNPIANISEFKMVNDSMLLMTSFGNLFLYNNSGEQIFVLDKKGRAQNEYLDVRNIYVTDKFIYIFDAMQLKMLVLDREYKYVKSFFPVKNSISKFIVHNNRYVCLYNSGGVSESVASIYDIETDKSVDVGKSTQEDKLLLMRQGAGALTVADGRLIFLRPSSLNFGVCDLGNNYHYREVEVNDPDFTVKKITGSAVDLINTDRNSAVSYLASNSVILDVNFYNDVYYVLAEVVSINGKRHIKLYKLSKDFKPIESISYPFAPMMACTLYKGSVLFIRPYKENEELSLRLYRFKD